MRLYEQGYHILAAEAFERLWAEHPHQPRFLLNAAAARRDAGQFAHATVYKDNYLSRVQLDDQTRRRVEASFAGMRERLTPVHVTMSLSPDSATDVTIVAERVAHAGQAPPPLTVPVKGIAGGRARLELDRGEWILRARAPGRDGTAVHVVVGESPIFVTIALQPTGTAPMRLVDGRRDRRRPPARERVASIALASAGGLSVFVGYSATGAGGAAVRRLADCTDLDLSIDAPGPFGWFDQPCAVSLRNGLRLRDVGVGVGAAGLGLLFGGLTGLLPTPLLRRRLLIAEVAFGGSLVVAGAIALPLASVAFNVDNQAYIESWHDHYRRHAPMVGHALAAHALGLGLGLVASSSVGLALGRRFPRLPRAVARLGPGGAQLTLSGSF